MKIISVEEMQKWEALTLKSKEATMVSLMKEAVEGIFEFIQRELTDLPIVICCGKGNNGNDGLWLAWLLKQNNHEVTALVLSSYQVPNELSELPPAKMASAACIWKNFDTSKPRQSRPRIVIDALLGLGARGAPRGETLEILQWVEQTQRPGDIHVSIDFPSGWDANSGESFIPCFRADYTCMIGAIKQGFSTESASKTLGRIRPISIPLQQDHPIKTEAEFFTQQDALALQKPPAVTTYKNKQGRVSVLAGTLGMAGASILTSRASLRSGAGLIYLYVPEEIYTYVATATPEVIVKSLPQNGLLPDTFFEAEAIVCGPGLGKTSKTISYVESILEHAKIPCVVDADALNILAENLSLLDNTNGQIILTPHRGELARLLHEAAPDRTEAAKKWVASWPNTILIAKGPNTLAITGKKTPSYNSSGNPGMATAGMGDVLAGIIGGLCAQEYTPWDAARLGTWWHGHAADLATQNSQTEQTLTASDVIDHMGKSWRLT